MTLPVTPSRILLVGSGGREHALAWRLGSEPGVSRVVAAPGSAGIATEPRVVEEPGVDPLDPDALVEVARRHAVELAVVGPEAPLAAGVADALVGAGIPTFGPGRAAARIESSKAFCREIAEAAGVPMARGGAFAEAGPALALAADLAGERGSGGVVVKADGLAAGKGVTVCDDVEAARAAIAAIFAGADPSAGPGAGSGDDGMAAPPRVVVEARLAGREASVIALCDGSDALALPAARDHKRLLDGDEGPNTGGMGAYSPLSDLPPDAIAEVVERFHRPVLAELARRGTPFRGALYAGLMLTDAGPVLLEFNARFGDPETQVLLPGLGVALAPLLLAAANGELAAARSALGLTSPLLPSTDESAVGVVLAAGGYPGTPRRGDRIEGLEAAAGAGALVFHAGTTRDPDGTWRTAGGRVLAVVGLGADLAEARATADAAAGRIRFVGVQRRRDIAAVAEEALR